MATKGKPSKPLSAASRKKMKPSSFGLPKQKKFPLDTTGRARNALARAAQGVKKGTTTPAQAAQVRNAVSRKFPSIQVTKPKKGK